MISTCSNCSNVIIFCCLQHRLFPIGAQLLSMCYLREHILTPRNRILHSTTTLAQILVIYKVFQHVPIVATIIFCCLQHRLFPIGAQLLSMRRSSWTHLHSSNTHIAFYYNCRLNTEGLGHIFTGFNSRTTTGIDHIFSCSNCCNDCHSNWSPWTIS